MKIFGNKRKVFLTSMDLETANNRIYRHCFWNVLRLYGLSSRLVRGVKSFYVNSRACVRVRNSISVWFSV